MTEENGRNLEKRKRAAFEKHKDYLIDSEIVVPELNDFSKEILRYKSGLTQAIEDYYGVRRRRKHQPPTGSMLPWVRDTGWSDQKDDLSVDDFVKTKDRLWCTGKPSELIEIIREINLDEDNELYNNPYLECSNVRYCFQLRNPIISQIMKPWFYVSIAGTLGCVITGAITSDPRYASGVAAAAPFAAISITALLHERFFYSKDEFSGSKSFFELYKKSREADKFIEGVKNETQ